MIGKGMQKYSILGITVYDYGAREADVYKRQPWRSMAVQTVAAVSTNPNVFINTMRKRIRAGIK